MKGNATVVNIGHLDDESDLSGVEGVYGIKVRNIKPQAVASCALIAVV